MKLSKIIVLQNPSEHPYGLSAYAGPKVYRLFESLPYMDSRYGFMILSSMENFAIANAKMVEEVIGVEFDTKDYLWSYVEQHKMDLGKAADNIISLCENTGILILAINVRDSKPLLMKIAEKLEKKVESRAVFNNPNLVLQLSFDGDLAFLSNI